MDFTDPPVEWLVLFRGIERLVIESAAVVCIVLGALLLRWGVLPPQRLDVSGSTFRLSFKNAAPGSLFALFGMGVLLAGLASPLSMNISREQVPLPAREVAPADESDGLTRTTPGQARVVKATYSSLLTESQRLVDALARTPEAPDGKARTLLDSHSATASRLLNRPCFSPAMSEFLERVRDARSQADAHGTWQALHQAALDIGSKSSLTEHPNNE